MPLLEQVLRGTTDLAGAACVGRSALFDAAALDEDLDELEYRHETARRLCQACPVLDRCTSWADEQPATDMVLAARIPSKTSRPRKPRKDSAA